MKSYLINFIQLVILINNVSCNINKLSNNTSIKTNETTLEININNNINNTILVKANERETITLKCPIELNSNINTLTSTSTTTSTTSTVNEEYDANDYELDEIEDENNDNQQDDDAKFILSSKTIDKREIFTLENDNSKIKKPNLIIHWYKDSARLNKYKILNTKYKQDGLNLKIKNLNLNDSGKYKCKIINGYGGVAYSSLNLVVSPLSLSTSTVINEDLRGKTSTSKSVAIPVFLNPDRVNKIQFYRRAKGSEIRFKCNARGQPKPDILWYKNGFVLNEEDYGITRSKWAIELKDLRISDNGNYTCKVFNKYGSINSTFQLNVYDDSDFVETSQPLNITIVSGTDAVFNCKLPSLTKPKWMKQISRAEYKNYVIQNNPSELQLLSQLDKLNQPTQSKKIDDLLNDEETKTTNTINDADESIKGFYLMSTQSPLSPLGTVDKTNDENDVDLSLSDLIGKDKIDSMIKDEDNSDLTEDSKFNFELFMPKKTQKLNPAKLKPDFSNKKDEDQNGVHYITLSSSPLIIEKQILNKEQNYYINQLIIKQADVKDSGIYVCFGNNAKIVRKAYLKVLPNNNNKIFNDNYDETLSKFKEILEKQNNNNNNNNKNKEKTIQTTWSFSINSLQSFGLLIVLIPVFIICSFAIISICYLRHLDEQKKKNLKNKKDSNVGCFKQIKSCFFKSSKNKNDKSNTGGFNCCCCPTYAAHVLMHDNFSDETETLSNNNKKLKQSSNTSSISSSTVDRNHHTTVGSTLTNSTTATTVAYYTVQVPVLMCDSPPPPLPITQPPHILSNTQNIIPSYQQNQYLNDSNEHDSSTNSSNKSSNLERSVSTPSMAYYKIVDCDLIDWNSIKSKNESEIAANKEIENNLTSSTNSRLYYQLTPSKPAN